MDQVQEAIQTQNENLVVGQTETSDSYITLDIFSGKHDGGTLVYKRLVGHAFLPDKGETYEIKLMMFPRHTYFLRRNRNSTDRYTVFAKRLMDHDNEIFRNPIAFGKPSERVINHLEIYIPLFGRLLFMDLVPKNTLEEL